MLATFIAQATTEALVKGAEPTPEKSGGFDTTQMLEKITDFAVLYGLKILAAVAIFVIGKLVAGFIVGLVTKLLNKRKVDPAVTSFTTNLISTGLMVFIFIAILKKLGVETTSLVAVIGAAGLAVGLALQGSLANFAAGFLIIVFKPFKIGDFVEANGVAGVIEHIYIFTTELRTPDNKVVIVPNSKMTDNNIINYSSAGNRRIDLVIGIAYDANIDDARKILLDIMSTDDRILQDPEPTVSVAELADSSVNLAVRPWTTVEDYWGVYFGTLEAVKKRFDKAGIGIPFPQRDVHLIQESKES